MNGDIYIPDCEEFRRGYESYNQLEKRGYKYFEAFNMIQNNWGDAESMARGVEILIRFWHRFFANFHFDDLVNCISRNMDILDSYRGRNINSLNDNDDNSIENLFNEFLHALRRIKDNQKSPVSVAKALSPIATHFFPLWDSNIAYKYNCFYLADIAASPYIRFCKKMKFMAEQVKDCVPTNDDRSLLKRIDEFNYSKYTMHWI